MFSNFIVPTFRRGKSGPTSSIWSSKSRQLIDGKCLHIAENILDSCAARNTQICHCLRAESNTQISEFHQLHCEFIYLVRRRTSNCVLVNTSLETAIQHRSCHRANTTKCVYYVKIVTNKMAKPMRKRRIHARLMNITSTSTQTSRKRSIAVVCRWTDV